jgi:hypothetical protein
VLDRPAWAETAEFRLQMKPLAFLEDLRAAHRKLSPTLRGLKRPVPPVVFLKGVTASNGGVELLSAMSDIRSRRSELHPLLVVASAAYEHRAALDDLAVAAAGLAPGPLHRLGGIPGHHAGAQPAASSPTGSWPSRGGTPRSWAWWSWAATPVPPRPRSAA